MLSNRRRAPRMTVASTHRSVLFSLAVNFCEAVALAVAALVTGSVALRSQVAANGADVAVGVFLLIGVLSSTRPPDESHPLGYGRDGFFWSLFAALGIFLGGAGLALEGAISSALHPVPLHSYTVAYVVLAITAVLDVQALRIVLRPVRQQAAERGTLLRAHLRRSTDSAASAVVVSGGCAVIGCAIAATGLVLTQLTHSQTPDVVASAAIGLLLLAASVLLLQSNRDLLSGRGVPPAMVRDMACTIAAQPGVVEVQDLFAVVVGPASLIVDGDVTFADELDVPALERTIMRCDAALRQHWPTIHYVYLMPVPSARPRPGARPRSVAGAATPGVPFPGPSRLPADASGPDSTVGGPSVAAPLPEPSSAGGRTAVGQGTHQSSPSVAIASSAVRRLLRLHRAR
jgi:cation diffusion facilitator family transporter